MYRKKDSDRSKIKNKKVVNLTQYPRKPSILIQFKPLQSVDFQNQIA